MLFNSFTFIFVFLPLVVAAYAALGQARAFGTARGWLVIASLFFYGWWNPAHLGLIAVSVLGNYSVAGFLDRTRRGRWVLALGVVANLLALGWYKYVGFFGSLLGFDLAPVVLPLAISFFTFTQIAYLVDVSRGRTAQGGLLDYVLFVTFFPHLVAGPIVHYRDVMPQFARSGFRLHGPDVRLGVAIFILGLAKKVLIADPVSSVADHIFGLAAAGTPLGAVDAWAGALAYTVQLYFDFSGYSDMAIGLARMFSVKFPANFDSPYQATSLIDFWRRWHMTLSQFLRDYLYIPLGGSRHGPVRRYLNLFLTMLLGGLWHGANWTFVCWGALHGFYLIVNHGLRTLRTRLCRPSGHLEGALRLAGWPLTFTCVVLGWVLFRSPDVATAAALLGDMAGAHGLGTLAEARHPTPALITAAVGLLLALFAPNSQRLLAAYAPTLEAVVPARIALRLDGWLVPVGLGLLLFFACQPLAAAKPSVFLYFNF